MYLNANAAYRRKDALAKVTELADKVVLHVVKIAMYPNDLNSNHWANEVDAWMRSIDRYLSNMKGAKYSRQLAVDTILGHVFFSHTHKPKQELLNDIVFVAYSENGSKAFDKQPSLISVVKLIEQLVDAAHLAVDIKPSLLKFAKETK